MKHVKYLLLIILTTQGFYSSAQVYQWTKRIGGAEDDIGWAITVNSQKDLYITGIFKGTVDFNPSSVLDTISSAGNADFFITKFDSLGSLKWVKTIGGINDDVACAITHDKLGNLYVAGYFEGTVDFDPSAANFNLTSLGYHDIFIAKYNSFGDLFWAKRIGGIKDDIGISLVTDNKGFLYVSGHFQDTVDFNPNSGISKLNSNGNYDGFIVKLDNLGNFYWAKNIGGVGSDQIFTSFSDSTSSIFVTGNHTNFIDLDPGSGVTGVNGRGVFIVKLDSLGDFVFGINAISTVNSANAYSLKQDENNDIYLTGQFVGTCDFDPSSNTINIVSNGMNDIFIAKYDSIGNYIWAKNIGGTGNDVGYSLEIDNSFNIYLGGEFSNSVDFDLSSNNAFLNSNGSSDMFIVKYDNLGNYIWSESIGGSSADHLFSFFLLDDGGFYITGDFQQTADFDFSTLGVANFTSAGKKDVFIAKYNQTITGIAESFQSFDLKIYPNPTQSKINIHSEISDFQQIVLYDITGKILINQNSTSGSEIIELSEFDNGVYFLKIVFNNKVSVHKIIKSN